MNATDTATTETRLAPAVGTMRVVWFHRTESNRDFHSERRSQVFEVEVPVTATLEDILAAGYAQRIPKGSARGGCFELQTDLGIWTSPTGNRLGMVPGRATYKTWEQLDEED